MSTAMRDNEVAIDPTGWMLPVEDSANSTGMHDNKTTMSQASKATGYSNQPNHLDAHGEGLSKFSEACKTNRQR